MSQRFVVVLVVAALVAGCGRREERASFDAKPVSTSSPGAAPVNRALPPDAAQVKWESPGGREIPAGQTVTLPITFTNAGPVSWPDDVTADPQKKDGSYAVRLVHRWVPAGQPLAPRVGGDRTDLPRPVAPGEKMTVLIGVRAPDAPGNYQLVVELVQELVQWFSDVGAETLTIPIRVVPAAAAPAPPR